MVSVPEAVLAQCPICGLFGAPGAVEIHANDCLNRQEREDFNRGRGVIGGELNVGKSLRESEPEISVGGGGSPRKLGSQTRGGRHSEGNVCRTKPASV